MGEGPRFEDNALWARSWRSVPQRLKPRGCLGFLWHGKGKKQIPFGNDKKKSNDKGKAASKSKKLRRAQLSIAQPSISILANWT